MRTEALPFCVGAIVMLAATPWSRAQDFADLKSALVDYSQAEVAPHQSCEALAKFKSKEIVRIAAAVIPAGAAPEHCRVTGLLAPEIAFEVSLPAKWNG